MQQLIDFFGIKDLIPHGYCLLWSPTLLWLDVISDLSIAFSYYSIPLILIYFIKQRKDLPYPWLVAMFAGFIVACGTTHLLAAITIWIPLYWLEGLLKGFTAIISVTTAALMLWVIPRVLSLPSAAQLQAEITQRKSVEEALRESDAFNESILNSLISQIIVLNEQGVIINVNKAYQLFTEENNTLNASQNMLGLNYLDVCKNGFNLTDGDNARAAYTGIKAVMAGKKGSFHLEYPCHSLKQEHWFLMTVLPLVGARRGVVVKHTEITDRKQAERVLVQLKAMIDISLDGFWIVDLMGRLIQVNEAYANISGYATEELINMSINQLEAQEYPEQISAHMTKVISEGYDRFETRHRHKNGQLIDIEISSAYLPEFQHFCVFCRDITERKAMEETLKASEAKFRSIIEASPVSMALNDESLNITFLNPAFVQTFGYGIDDIPNLAQWCLKAYPDPIYRSWVNAKWHAMQEKTIQGQTDIPPLEVTVRCKNNSIKNVLVSIAPIKHDFVGLNLAIFYDITERKQIEAKLNAIFDASIEGIITVDMSDSIVSANAAVVGIFGYTPEELTGHSISNLIDLSQRKIEHQQKTGSQVEEIEGMHKNGSLVPLEVSTAKYPIDDNFYVTYIVRDVSQRKRQEQQDNEHLNQLAHVTRLGLMGEMASGIAHEVNQPLAAVSSYTQVSLNLINNDNPDLVLLSEILEKTKEQALRAGQIIHRMRAFVQSHAKHRSITDINPLIQESVSLCRAELKQNDISLILKLADNLPPIYADHVQIEQVIINLIRNSIDALSYLPQNRHLTILSHLTPNNHIKVEVEDNGPGINVDQQQKIFMPFYTTKTNGMGMGLSISRSLIEFHDGSLNFSSCPGTGTTFYFSLPIRQ